MVDAHGQARINGPLTLSTVTALYNQANSEATRGRRMVTLDLEYVPSVDSSGLALLLEWQSLAAAAGTMLHVRNAPEDLLSLARLCEAGDLLVIEGRNSGQKKESDPQSSQNQK